MKADLKARVTVSISRRNLTYLDGQARKKKSSRSQVLDSMIRECQTIEREERLARLARSFFTQPEPEYEARERRGWFQASLETLNLDR